MSALRALPLAVARQKLWIKAATRHTRRASQGTHHPHRTATTYTAIPNLIHEEVSENSTTNRPPYASRQQEGGVFEQQSGSHNGSRGRLSGQGQPESISGVSGAAGHSVNVSATAAAPTIEKRPSPRQVIQDDLALVHQEIKENFNTQHQLLHSSACYYFDQKGKNIRPIILLLAAKACSYTFPTSHPSHGNVAANQRTLAMIAEMIHTSSLVHDDVIDEAETRRNKASANVKYGDRQAIYAGDYILAKASLALAQLNSTRVVTIMSCIIDDLVNGEFMQLSNEPDPRIRFQHYLDKTYNKTASLLARGCEAVAAVIPHPDPICTLAYQYGKDVGMAFQLIDDYLDFVSTAEQMGKPTSADLKLGLATAPVLYAAEEHPELNRMIVRQFKTRGDVDRARLLVEKSNGLARTRALAQQYCDSAVATIKQLPDSPARQALIDVTTEILTRTK
eukprot:comp11421_c0_seq1/m.5821 comp11421_c0_seq1/g.5821  ORF comp11421_c0_seq1/g.5821 comp11421_c0_seq1/m.5821 type:complete len:450 (-) comp11421_c0_seq1:60-1409(-)